MDQVLSSGKVVPHYYGSFGEHSGSLAGAWRIWEAASGSASQGSRPELVWAAGQRAKVWWTIDACWFFGSVLERKDDLIHIFYDDGAQMWHDLLTTRVEDANLQPLPPQRSLPPPHTKKPKRRSGSVEFTVVECTQCSVPDCTVSSVNGRHAGLHMFPSPKRRRR